MNKAPNLLLLIVLVFAACSSPNRRQMQYDKTKVGRYKELVFHETPLRGIESEDGIVYYVEKDLRNLSAYDDNSLLWRVDVIAACGNPSVGRPEIRDFSVQQDTIWVTYGKHSYAVVDTKTGKATFWGAD